MSGKRGITTSLDLALAYIRKGWNPVPIPDRSKAPTGDWGTRLIDERSAPDHFNGDPLNIGIQMGATSRGLTDADLDSPEAIAIAPYLLPRTPAIFGRASKRNSHRLYYTDLAETHDIAAVRLQTPEQVTLCELRIGGKAAQTVFPGSTHPSGEPITWESEGEPASVDGAELLASLKLVAAAALIARHWPADGGRHFAASAVGGFLARAGLAEARIKLIAEAIARAAGDEEWRDRANTAEDAAQKHRAGGRAYGFPQMVKVIGEPAARKVADWIGYDARSDQAEEAQPQEQPATPVALGEWDAGDDITLPPPRGWLLGTVFARTFLSSLIAEGGTGKTALRYAQYLSLATARQLAGEHVFVRSRVLIVSLEDNADELRRRILAARLHHRIERQEVSGWLYLAAPGAHAGKLMGLDPKGRPVLGMLAASLEATILARKIDLVALDPFIKSHAVGENDNNAIDQVAQILTDLAAKHDIAVDVPHHVRKGASDPGNADRGRGASSAKDAARLVYSLATMSTEEATAFKIPEGERRRYIRMDSAKVNIAPPMGKAKWFRLVGVPLGNKTDLYPNGDVVQTVEPWDPPDTWADLSTDLITRILDEIDAGMKNGSRYSAAARAKDRAKDRAAWRVVTKHAPHKTEPQAREIIRTWIKNGVLIEYEYTDPNQRRKRTGLRVGNRPGNVAS